MMDNFDCMTLPENWSAQKKCHHCGSSFEATGVRQRFCSLPCTLWSKVDIRGADECWPWRAKTRWKGYGKFTRNGITMWAHRVAFELSHQTSPPALVCHECDNPCCCNPAHLFAGDVHKNNADKIAKDRQARGNRYKSAKLNEAKVRAIRASSLSNTELAKKYDVARATIYNVRHRLKWAHVK
ncbi:HNH endonuclease [Thalassovita mediterranea]|nr:HNH endonuclease [Thalassovita mediterranea]